MTNTRLNVYRLATSARGFKTGLFVDYNKQCAIECFSRLHCLHSSQIAVLYSYPLRALS